MQAMSIQNARRTTVVPVLSTLAVITAALLAALLLGSLLAADWTLPMEPAISATFTA